jgi:uncharacterized protein YcnI
MRRLWTFTGLTVALIGLLAAPAFAHAEFDPDTVAAGASVTLHLSVPNEETTAATVKVELQLPTDHPLTNITINDVAGWKGSMSGNVITWTGGPLKGTDTVSLDFTATTPSGVDQINFVALQTYDNGDVVRWADPDKADGSEPEHPFPRLKFGAASDSTTTAAASTTAAATSTTAAVTTTTAPAKKSDSSSSTGWIIGIIAAVIVVGGGAGILIAKRRP